MKFENIISTKIYQKNDEISEEKIINMIDKYLKDKTYVIVTHRVRLKELCNRHYVFENHMMKEMILKDFQNIIFSE